MWVESIEMKQVNILVTIFLLAKVLFPAQTRMKLLISVRAKLFLMSTTWVCPKM